MRSWRPMPLIRVDSAFDHPDWLFELKHDGFRAFAVIDGHRCTLISRRGHVFKQWPQLAEELAHAVRVRSAVLDGEVCCLRRDGGADFNALLFRRGWPFFYAFDVLEVDGVDLRDRSLIERKRRLKAVLPRIETSIRYVDHVRGRGRDLFEAVCGADAEGVVAKWAQGHYHVDGTTTSWLKIKNRGYSQMIGRHDLFADRGSGRPRGRAPAYRLDPTALVDSGWSTFGAQGSKPR